MISHQAPAERMVNMPSGFKERVPRMPKVRMKPRRELAKMTERGNRKAQKARKKNKATFSELSGVAWVIRTARAAHSSKVMTAVLRKLRWLFFCMSYLFY